ncbi:MAG TPA: CDP-diacylglycerol--glycerol-3-phosphate 3-phosphatidyltransferase [Solirubrobacteraceae bacterium]|nr:CDP-diacylglycerol--glycerol-3-phosphate 3-phosphatidyltransferase [Solirubrobacteraceae bacterium]
MPLNLPNVLTLSRIGFVPLLLVLLLGEQTGPIPAAAAVFGVAALTDAADGHIARSRDMVTSFGRIADPLADKLLVGTALASLVMIDRLALWIALVIGAREAGVALLRWHAGRQGIALNVSSLGKVKTCLQMSMLVTLMLVPDPDAAWVTALLMVVVAFTIVSGAQYLLAYLRLQPTSSKSPGSSTRVRSMYSRM